MRVTEGSRHRLVLAALAATLLVTAAAAAAEAPTRDEYVARLEQICKPDTEATQRAMKGARADVQAERFGVAAGKFAEGTRIFHSTVKEMAAVPRPPADLAKLGKWFGYLKKQESYIGGATVKLRQEEPIKFQRLISRFIHNGNLANYEVLAFGFNHCSFKFSRYG